MPFTPTEICNLALLDLGRPPISDLEEDSTAARYCKAAYEPTVNELLRDHPWNFATKRVKLSDDPEQPISEWSNRAQLPNDCLRVVLLNDVYTYYVIEGRFILSNCSTPVLYYIARVPEGQFDTLFVSALAGVLTARLCVPITDNATGAKQYWETAKEKLMAARTVDAQEQPPGPLPRTVWEVARSPGYSDW